MSKSQINKHSLEVYQVSCPPSRDTPKALDDLLIIEKGENTSFCPTQNDFLPDAGTPSLKILKIIREKYEGDKDDDDDDRKQHPSSTDQTRNGDDEDDDDDEEDDDDDKDGNEGNTRISLSSDGKCFLIEGGNGNNKVVSVRYQICYNNGKCSEATTQIRTVNTKNHKPALADEQVITSPRKPVTIDILHNDRPNTGDIHVNIISVQNGTAKLQNRKLVFAPDEGFSGLGKVTYEVCLRKKNKNSCQTATTYIHVCDLSPVPVAKNDSYSVVVGNILDVPAPGVLQNDLGNGATGIRSVVTSPPGKGTVQLNVNGSFRYIPAAQATGEDSFTYTLTTNEGTSDIAEVSIRLIAAEQPFKTNPDTYRLSQGGKLSVSEANGVLGNDSNNSGQEAIAVLRQGSRHGTITLRENGSFEYTHNGSETREDSFTYSVKSGDIFSDTETVTLNITNVNDVPVGNFDEYHVPGNNTRLIVTAEEGVLKNDRDPENATLTAVLVDQPSTGRVELEASGGFTFISTTPITSPQVFTYKAFDGEKYSSLISVTLTPTENAPFTAENDSYSLTAGVILNTDFKTGLLGNDTYEGQTPEIRIIRPPSSGTLTINNDGSFRYSTTSDMGGTEIAAYRLVAGDRQSNEALITFTITPKNLPPVVKNEGPISLQAGQSVTLNVLENDNDPEGQSLYLTELSLDDPTAGSVSWNDRGTLTFTAHYLYSGQVNANYIVSDGQNEVSGRATLEVSPPDAITMTVRSGDVINLCESFSAYNRSVVQVDHIYREPVYGKIKEQENCPDYFPENEEYRVMADNITLNTCEASGACRTISINIEVIPALKIFEGFSPNNDYLNETWEISGIEWYPDNKVQVFNQNGEIVYEGIRYDNEAVVWDGYGNYGRYAGNQLPAGPYTYVVKLDSDMTRKGMVVIAR